MVGSQWILGTALSSLKLTGRESLGIGVALRNRRYSYGCMLDWIINLKHGLILYRYLLF